MVGLCCHASVLECLPQIVFDKCDTNDAPAHHLHTHTHIRALLTARMPPSKGTCLRYMQQRNAVHPIRKLQNSAGSYLDKTMNKFVSRLVRKLNVDQ